MTSAGSRTELAVVSPRSTNTTAAVCLQYVVANERLVTLTSVELSIADSFTLVYNHQHTSFYLLTCKSRLDQLNF